MLDSVIFETERGNAYLHSPHMKQLLLLHPVLVFLFQLRKQGIAPDVWYHQLEGEGVVLDGGHFTTREDLRYYVNKYKYLEAQGYFQPVDSDAVLSGRLEADDIEFQLANCRQLTFEVTEACNLNCHYCGYGKFYNRSTVRDRKKMNWGQARRFLDYAARYWNSNVNTSHNKNIDISFYGGEPLLNFSLIKQVTEYANSLEMKHNHFTFSMTNNGTMLDKYMDFLAEHKFMLHISLDGDEFQNGYRVFHDGSPSFKKIIENVEALKKKHPHYFEEYVHFITVLHNKNSVADVMRYFKDKYNKQALILELNTNQIQPERAEEFRQTYKNFRESLENSDQYCEIRRDFFPQTPEVRTTNLFLRAYSGNAYDHLHQLLHLDGKVQYIPTATCLPFGRRIYITAGGSILPCERIDYRYALGTVDQEAVHLDFEAVARRYNSYYDKLRHLCGKCYKTGDCGHCLFYLPGIDEDAKARCPGCAGPDHFSRIISQPMTALEESPEIYSMFMEDVNIT